MSETEFIIEPGRQDIIMTHVFDAPRDVVFKAMSDPELIPRWWGQRGNPAIVDEADVRPGGRWRFLHRDDDGNEYGFRGVYHDVVAPERVVQTFEFEGLPGHVCLETITLEEVDGKTKYTGLSVYQSVEDRDGMAASGMQDGARESLELLAELVAELLSKANS
ncbi:MAG: ATPase [Pseudonocardiaceae bacterium]|nr:ATPase [Pseudonocardiaceae bacterium]